MAVCKFCGAPVSAGEKCEYCGQIAEPWYYPDFSQEPSETYKRKDDPIGEATVYVVKSGDNLWGISKRFYGRGDLCHIIAKENKIKNPNLIYPGQVLEIPKEVQIERIRQSHKFVKR